jgi:hypothetical protein
VHANSVDLAADLARRKVTQSRLMNQPTCLDVADGPVRRVGQEHLRLGEELALLLVLPRVGRVREGHLSGCVVRRWVVLGCLGLSSGLNLCRVVLFACCWR